MNGLSMETYFPLDERTTPEIHKQSDFVINQHEVNVEDPEWLEKLIKETHKPFILGMLLKNPYILNEFHGHGMKALKSSDLERFSLLSQTNTHLKATKQHLAFYICYVNLVIEWRDVSGYFNTTEFLNPNYPNRWKESRRDLNITAWYDVDGRPVHNFSRFDIEHFTMIFDLESKNNNVEIRPVNLRLENEWRAIIEDIPSTKEIFEHDLQLGASKTIIYSTHVLVMWPQRFEFDLVLSANLHSALDWLFDSIVASRIAGRHERECFRALIDRIRREKNQLVLDDQQVAQIYELLIGFNELGLVEKFFFACIPTQNLVSLANNAALCKIITQFDPQRLKPLLDSLFSRNNRMRNLIAYLDLIMHLKMNKMTELAQEYLGIRVLVLVNQLDKLEHWIDRYLQQPVHHLILAFKCLRLFHDQYTRTLLSRMAAIVVKRMNERGEFRDLVDEIWKLYHNATKTASKNDENKELIKSHLIAKILKERRAWLEMRVQHAPTFSWRMPHARFSSHPRIETFLHSNQPEMSYLFGTSEDARKIVELQNRSETFGSANGRGYSIEILNGPASNILVIRKTRTMFEMELACYNRLVDELKKISDYLKIISKE